RRSHVPTETAGREDSTSLYAELGLSGSDTESDEEMPSVGRSGTQDEGQAGSDPGTLDEGQAGSDPGTRNEGQAGSDPGTLDEGQAGSVPGTRDEGQAGTNPDDVAESLPLPTPSVLAGPNLEHSDVEITDPSSQPLPEHMDEGFTATAYPDVQENLKLTVDEQVIPEEPVSSTGTLSSLQHLAKDFSFGDQFLNDKPSEADNEKTTADTEAESMVSVTIQQDTSITPPMTSPVIDLVSRPDSPNVHWPLPTTTTTTAAPTTTTTTTTLPLPPQPQQGSSESLLIKRMGELEQHIADLVEENQALESRLTKQGSRINKLESVDVSKMIREQTVEFIDSQEIDRKINESVKEVVSLSVKHAMRAPLRARFKDLPTSDMKEILLQRMLEENYDKGHAEHRVAYEALRTLLAVINGELLRTFCHHHQFLSSTWIRIIANPMGTSGTDRLLQLNTLLGQQLTLESSPASTGTCVPEDALYGMMKTTMHINEAVSSDDVRSAVSSEQGAHVNIDVHRADRYLTSELSGVWLRESTEKYMDWSFGGFCCFEVSQVEYEGAVT
ncbi:hypothetical protein Tco_0540115, partial [Tanacetum coccineum]